MKYYIVIKYRIKVHLNLSFTASGMHFGPLESTVRSLGLRWTETRSTRATWSRFSRILTACLLVRHILLLRDLRNRTILR